MTRSYSVLGSCIAASSLLFFSTQVLAAEVLQRRFEPARMPHSVADASAPKQEKFSSSFDIKGAQHAIFNFTVGAPGKITVNVQSKGDPVTGFLLTPGGVNVPLNGASPHEYTANADDIRKGEQWKVDVSMIAPKSAQRNAVLNSTGHASGDITILHPAGGGNSPQAIREIPKKIANSGSATSAAAHVTDQPLTQAPAVLAQTVAAQRTDESSSNSAGNTNQTQSQPVSQNVDQQQNQTAQQDVNQPQNQQHQPAPQDTNQSQYQQPNQPAQQDANQQQQQQPAAQDTNQSQYQQPNQTAQQDVNQQQQQQQYQPVPQDTNQSQYQQPNQPAQQDVNQQQQQQQYQPAPQDTNQSQYQQPNQPAQQDVNQQQQQQQYQPAPQNPSQSQYQQQYLQLSDTPAVQSPLQQQSTQYQQPNYQGQQYQGQPPAMPQQNQVQPSYSPGMGAPGGACTVKLSVDRSTINLLDANTGSERKHLSLGQDRVQKVFSSPDNAWSVAVYKIRGAQQYGFIALDLAKCEDQLPADLSAIPSEARFDQAEVVLMIDSKEKRFPLRNSRMQ